MHTWVQDYCARESNPGAHSYYNIQFMDIPLFSFLYWIPH